jgi:hypothetical protein
VAGRFAERLGGVSTLRGCSLGCADAPMRRCAGESVSRVQATPHHPSWWDHQTGRHGPSAEARHFPPDALIFLP